jgi:hypothetical protein
MPPPAFQMLPTTVSNKSVLVSTTVATFNGFTANHRGHLKWHGTAVMPPAATVTKLALLQYMLCAIYCNIANNLL